MKVSCHLHVMTIASNFDTHVYYYALNCIYIAPTIKLTLPDNHLARDYNDQFLDFMQHTLLKHPIL